MSREVFLSAAASRFHAMPACLPQMPHFFLGGFERERGEARAEQADATMHAGKGCQPQHAMPCLHALFCLMEAFLYGRQEGKR